MVKTILTVLVGYAALYAVVWLHEVGHAIGYAYYGCKKNWLHVNVRPYIFFSTPAPVDTEKSQFLTCRQHTIISYGGIIANLIWAVSGFVLAKLLPISNEYIALFLTLFYTLHLAEIVSYLFIGNLYLVSDMAIIASLYPKLRIPNLIAGVLLTVLYGVVLANVSSAILVTVLFWNITTILCMCGGRIVFSELHKRRSAKDR